MKSTPNLNICTITPAARSPIEVLLKRTKFFEPYEIEVALELIDIALENPKQKDYLFGVAEKGGKVVGYCCYGPTSMTTGTFDLYWICVAPDYQRDGIGKLLMDWVEEQVRAEKGRLIVVETSGKSLYEPTRSFYLKIGYIEEARIKDFYRPGDDQVIFTKMLK